MAGEVTFDDYMENRLAVPRYKGDSIASEFQDKILKSKAAVAALRNDPRALAMNNDADASIHFEQSLGDQTAGDYTPSKKRIRVAANRNVDDMRNTLHHETLHNLQRQGAREEYPYLRRSPISPGGVLYQYDKPALPGYEGSPKEFAAALGDNYMNYNTGEAAAFMGSALNQPMKIGNNERKVISQFPGLAGMFAGQTAQPNRPTPKHYKGYPEMSLVEKGLYNVGMLPDAMAILPDEARYSAAQQMVLRRLNEETNPRDRH